MRDTNPWLHKLKQRGKRGLPPLARCFQYSVVQEAKLEIFLLNAQRYIKHESQDDAVYPALYRQAVAVLACPCEKAGSLGLGLNKRKNRVK